MAESIFTPKAGATSLGVGVLAFTDLKTADYTAVAGELVLVDPLAIGNFTVFAPADPAINDSFGVKKASSGGTAIVNFNGSTINGADTTLGLGGGFDGAAYQYNGTEWSSIP